MSLARRVGRCFRHLVQPSRQASGNDDCKVFPDQSDSQGSLNWRESYRATLSTAILSTGFNECLGVIPCFSFVILIRVLSRLQKETPDMIRHSAPRF